MTVMKPFRFQQRRTKGWRKPADGCCVSRPGRWGNPFDFRDYGGGIKGRAESVRLFREDLIDHKHGRVQFTCDDVQRELQGRPLGCYCGLGEPCHGDVLLEVANAPAGN